MLKKLISTLILIALAVVIPLLGKAYLLTHWRIEVVMATIILLMFTQPPVASVRETSCEDRHTLWLILGLSVLSVATPIVEWAWFRPQPEARELTNFSVLGMILMLAGCALRLWAIAKLGKWFTAEVKIQPDQPLITSGPFRIVRHPSYLGAYLTFWGVGLLLEAFFGVFLAGFAMFWAYRNRIAAEELVLAQHFKVEWAAFAARKSRLIPFVW